MTMLTRDAILGASDIEIETVDVPEWGGSVRVKGLTASQRDKYERSLIQTNSKGKSELTLANARARLVALTVVDDDGGLMFSDADVLTLGTKSAAAMDRIYGVASRLAGLSDDDMDELVGNSEAGQSGDSPSA